MGVIELKNIPSGKFDLIASSVGYKKFSTSLLFLDSSLHFNFSLAEDITTLKEVVVRPNRSDFKKYYHTFEKQFLGLTPNSSHCSIMNQDAINLEFNKEENALHAYATEPIQVENRALGYVDLLIGWKNLKSTITKVFPNFMEYQDLKKLRQIKNLNKPTG